jgi:hypothetical protein
MCNTATRGAINRGEYDILRTLDLNIICVRSEVFTAVTVKNAVFWDIAPCGSCKNGRFGGMHRLHHQSNKNQRARNNVHSNQQSKHAAKLLLTLFLFRRFLLP